MRTLTRAFNDMTARLQAEDSNRRRLLADVGHELRTPLAVIQGNLEALLDGVYPADEAHLAPILEETRVMARLIDDLRTVSLAESGVLPLHREATDIPALVEDVAAAHRPTAEARGAHINVAREGVEPIPVAEVDPVRIRQVVSNLVDNALRHVPQGGFVNIGVDVVPAEPAPNTISIAVSDNGPGVPDELRDTVFERFTKGEGSRGSGLGLAIARAIVQAHGGSIALADNVAGDQRLAMDATGTRIRLTLPIRPPDAPPGNPEPASRV
jgi:two-component system, OmpR family, sensor histidine kinase BaeS